MYADIFLLFIEKSRFPPVAVLLSKDNPVALTGFGFIFEAVHRRHLTFCFVDDVYSYRTPNKKSFLNYF